MGSSQLVGRKMLDSTGRTGLLTEALTKVLSTCVADPELGTEVERRSHPFLPADGLLFKQNDPATFLYFVKEGEVMITMESSGRALMRVCAVGRSLIGLPAIISGTPYTMTARVSRDAQVFRLGIEEFRTLLKDQPRFSLSVLQIMAAEVHSARSALSNLLKN